MNCSDKAHGTNVRSDRAAAAILPRHIAILNFTGFHANWGCQATSWELLKFLGSCFDDLPQFSLVPQLPHCALDVELSDRLDEIYTAFDAVLDGSQRANSRLRFLERLCLDRYGFWAEHVRSADCVVLQGEGKMSGAADFHHGVGLLLAPFVAQHAWRKPVISVNQTIFGRDPKLLATAARIFGSFDLTAVREAASLQFATSLGIECHYIPDMAFLTKPCPDFMLPQLNPANKYFCVTGSALSVPGIDEFIFECADRLRSETGMIPVLAAAKDKKLRGMAGSFWSPGMYERIESDVPYPAVAHILKECTFLIGGRYHMAIMAAAVGTPSLLLRGNTFKNEGLAGAIGVQLPLRDIGDTEGVASDARQLLDNIGRVRSDLRAAMATVRADLDAGRSLLRQRIAGFGEHSATLPCAPRMNLTPDLMDYYADAASAKEVFVRNKASKRQSDTTEERLGRMPTSAEARRFLLAACGGDAACTNALLGNIVWTVSQPRPERTMFATVARLRTMIRAPARRG
jgi:Polysaccharide pyruvyl transferase